MKPVARPLHAKIESCSDGPSQASGMEGRIMGEYSEVYVAFDTAKLKHAVALAEEGRGGELRFLGEIEN